MSEAWHRSFWIPIRDLNKLDSATGSIITSNIADQTKPTDPMEPDHATLLIICGPNQGRRATAVPGQNLVVGRAKTTDFAVMDPRMSRRHFVIQFRDSGWLVQDLGSSNGTLLNRSPVKEATIKDGDVIVAGDTGYQLIIGPSRIASAAPDSGAEHGTHESNMATWKKDEEV